MFDINRDAKNSKYNVKNAVGLIERIKNTIILSGSFLVSFDVTSLFTNIPLDFLEEIIHNRWNEIQAFTNITETEFMQLLNFIIRDCNQFIYDNVIYKQLEGVPMGLPLSPVLADIVMEYVLDKAISQLKYKLQECIKYVDDLFLIVPRHLLSYTHQIFKLTHPKIQFTFVSEENELIKYVDVNLIHNANDSIEFNWYSKSTSSGRLLNYFSNHPMTHKLNVVDNLIKRLYGLSSEKFHKNNTKIIKTLLRRNGYLMRCINRRINKYWHKVRSRNSQDLDSNESNVTQTINQFEYRGIQYNNLCSQNIGKINCKGFPELKLGYKPSITNRTVFSKMKQKTRQEDMYNVVYNMPCLGDGFNSTCDLSYVGQTGITNKCRGEQHVNDIKIFNQRSQWNYGSCTTLP